MHLDLKVQVRDVAQAKLVAYLIESTGAQILQLSLHIPAVPESPVGNTGFPSPTTTEEPS